MSNIKTEKLKKLMKEEKNLIIITKKNDFIYIKQNHSFCI